MKSITVHELHELLRQSQPIDLIDVRSAAEYAWAHVEGARLVPSGALETGAAGRDSRPVYVICHGGGRSASVCARLRAAGVDAVNVDGGTSAWIQAGYPVVRQREAAARQTLRMILRPAAVVLAVVALVLAFVVHPLFALAAAAIWVGLVATGGCPLSTCSLPTSKTP